MDSDDLPSLEGMISTVWSTPIEGINLVLQEAHLNLEVGEDDFTVWIAFKGNMKDGDFSNKLDQIVNNMPCLLKMGKNCIPRSSSKTSPFLLQTKVAFASMSMLFM